MSNWYHDVALIVVALGAGLLWAISRQLDRMIALLRKVTLAEEWHTRAYARLSEIEINTRTVSVDLDDHEAEISQSLH